MSTRRSIILSHLQGREECTGGFTCDFHMHCLIQSPWSRAREMLVSQFHRCGSWGPEELRRFAKSYISRSGRTANQTQLVLVWFHVWCSLPSPQMIPTIIWSFGQRVETSTLIITVQKCVMQGTSLPVHKWFKDPSTSLGELHSACTLASNSSHLRWQSPTQLWRLRPPWAPSGSFPWYLCHPASQTYSSPFFFSLKLKGKQAVSMQSVSSWT